MAVTPKSADAKTLMVLGLLQSGPKHGYEIHRIVVAHGTLYADFKKPTLYHLLHRLRDHGDVGAQAETGTRGRLGERLVFSLTSTGSVTFQQLLRQALSTYDPTQTTFQIAAAYLPWLPTSEAQALLARRTAVIEELYAEVVGDLDHLDAQPGSRVMAARSLAADHALSLLSAELAWLERAQRHIAQPNGAATTLKRSASAPQSAKLPQSAESADPH